jgi:hypothetical protein
MSEWRTIDFRPAPPGWCIVHLSHESATCRRLPLAGWLVQEDDGGERRVVAGDVDENGEVAPALVGMWNVSGWYVAGPGDPDPTPEEIEQERERRREEHAKASAARKATA